MLPVPGTGRRSRLEENVAALDVRLGAEDLDRLAPLASDAVGTWY